MVRSIEGLWDVGPHHIDGNYSNRYGFTHDSLTLDNEAPELHFNFPNPIRVDGLSMAISRSVL